LNVHAPSAKSDDSEDSVYEELEQVFDHFPKDHIKILLGNLNSEVGGGEREYFSNRELGVKVYIHQDRVEQFALRSINLLILLGKRISCLRSGRSRSLYLFIRRALKQTVVTTDVYHFVKHVQNFIQHPAVKVNSICINYWELSMWISTQQINYCPYILHSLNT
jgi:hypothetical protein